MAEICCTKWIDGRTAIGDYGVTGARHQSYRSQRDGQRAGAQHAEILSHAR